MTLMGFFVWCVNRSPTCSVADFKRFKVKKASTLSWSTIREDKPQFSRKESLMDFCVRFWSVPTSDFLDKLA